MLKDEIENAIRTANGRVEFTLERSRGETYGSDGPALYCHDSYSRGSVLQGQTRRRFIEEWPNWETARAVLAALPRIPRFRVVDLGPDGGTTHRPVAEMVAHLPEDEG